MSQYLSTTAEDATLTMIENALDCEHKIKQESNHLQCALDIGVGGKDYLEHCSRMLILWKAASYTHSNNALVICINPNMHSPYVCGLLAHLCATWAKTAALADRYRLLQQKWLFAATWQPIDTLPASASYDWIFWKNGTQEIVDFSDGATPFWLAHATHWRRASNNELRSYYQRATK